MTAMGSGGQERRVLRRCASCRLLFEVPESASVCVVCGVPVEGLALPLGADPIPTELAEREPTAPLVLK